MTPRIIPYSSTIGVLEFLWDLSSGLVVGMCLYYLSVPPIQISLLTIVKTASRRVFLPVCPLIPDLRVGGRIMFFFKEKKWNILGLPHSEGSRKCICITVFLLFCGSWVFLVTALGIVSAISNELCAVCCWISRIQSRSRRAEIGMPKGQKENTVKQIPEGKLILYTFPFPSGHRIAVSGKWRALPCPLFFFVLNKTQ